MTKFALIALLIAPTVYATTTPTPTPTATQSQDQSQVQNQGQSQIQNATGGSAEATGGDSSLVNNYPRQAPSLGQGSISIAGCGASGNAGGSNTHGAAFLGLAWTPADCKLLLAAAAYQALGMYDAACEMVNGVSTVKKQWKALGKSPPLCAVKPADKPADPPVVVNVTQTTPTPAACATTESVEKAFQQCVSK